ncbi:MAG: DUF5995 family protein [Cellulomonas sp.]|uniref:DUF5995 family protein n=1 Tax=Cellulomonas sp. TaxID=40001 RepID=UPI0025826442|nr:DUF5995 family protein [Cellulomonas sp.]MCR6705444.1 DUF5995 family protein [Cellulomonas sp.]
MGVPSGEPNGVPSGSVAIGRVLAAMDAERAQWSRTDGLGVFSDVYRDVTALVAVRVTDGTFTHPDFVEDLDVRFAGLFLDVPRDLAARRTVNKAWAPLVERRAHAGLWPLQLALAGMNAHINHDLPLAVVATCEARGVPPTARGVHADFERVNDVLAEVVRPLRQSFLDARVVAAGGELSPVADLVSNFSIDKARDAAWANALVLWHVRDLGFVAAAARDALARTVGLVSRQLLTVFPDPLDRP